MQVRSGSFLTKRYSAIISIIFLFITADIFFLPDSFDLIIFGVLGLYGGILWFFKLKSKLTFIFCIIFLILMFCLFIFTGTSKSTEKAAVWFFLFFAVGLVQQFIE